MSPAPAQLGPYTIDRELGRGGMGVVYLGHDTRLDRRVAVKVLPEHLAQDPDRLARFEREARTLAQLNHPNVAGIHGVEEHEGARYLILEYVEGETLADRLDRGPLPMDEAVQIATRIAAGVEAAHEAGVIHRDLKPGNVIVTPEGQAKVLDFGLARCEDPSSSSSASAESEQPTLTSPAAQRSPTMPGVLLGTAAYMSPEQARGRRVDKRTDIWSFGVILYEMLTGHGPFFGETVSDSIGAVLHKDVDLERLPKATPPRVRRVLRRCLERDPAKRLRDIGDAALELADARAFGEEADAAAPRMPLVALGTLLAGLVIGAGAILLLRPASPVVETSAPLLEPRHFSIELPESAPLAPPSAFPFGAGRRVFDISPDGRTLLYTALVGGRTHLYTRDMATGEVQPVPGGGDGFDAVFSPDGRDIAFFA
ncbi:MAG: protein kinase domain-containing protein, partial [Planctomycetota bacterium]